MEVQNGKTAEGKDLEIPDKLFMDLHFGLAVLLPGTYCKGTPLQIENKICTLLLMAKLTL